jgi:uncharacterized protein GlcG (DUF336 family)
MRIDVAPGGGSPFHRSTIHRDPIHRNRARREGAPRHGAAPALALLLLAACGSGGRTPKITVTSFAPLVVSDGLNDAEIDIIVRAAAEAVDTPNLAIAVTDRIGNVLRVWNRRAGANLSDTENDVAAALARTAAFLSHSQAPLTSRTGQFISTFHFPATFGAVAVDADGKPGQLTSGVRNTAQGPLWQIDASNRGALIASALTNPPTAFDAGQAIPRQVNPDGSVPAPGLVALPGGVPLYKRVASAIAAPGTFGVERRLVGALGVYSIDASNTVRADAGEFAAITGSKALNPATGEAYDFGPIPNEGAVYLVGVLLPYFGQVARPAGTNPGTYDPLRTLLDAAGGGRTDPFGYVISPRDSASGVAFTASEVRTIIDQCALAAARTHAAIRLPASAPTAMWITVTDVNGVILGCFRMEDATLFSFEISLTKARNSVYFSNPASIDVTGPRAGRHPLDGIVPPGTAVTCRTLGFLSQPNYPPTIEGNAEGPLFALAQENRRPVRFNQMGFAPPAVNDTQSGIIFFPGSAPLYRGGTLIGGIGVSGDGVEQDDLVTVRGLRAAEAILGFDLEPPPAIRCDNFEFRGARLPYAKFPQHPDG